MKDAFDDLSKALAEGVSRREAIKRFGVAGAAAAAALVLPGRIRAATPAAKGGPVPSGCKDFCNYLFGQGTPDALSCIDDARHHTGWCYQYGPHSPACLQINCPKHTICYSANINQTSNGAPFCIPIVTT